MLDIEKLRSLKTDGIICIGSHSSIVQSLIDYDYLLGKKKPSLLAIIASGKKTDRYFWGKDEFLVPIFPSCEQIPIRLKKEISFFVNVTSGRRVLQTTKEALDFLPKIAGGVIFAENIPEIHAIELSAYANAQNRFLIGPSSVGLLLPEKFKLGAIGGVDYTQLISAQIMKAGNIAVFSSSGGMTNELITMVTGAGKRISFSLSFGGDRFPMTTPYEAFLAAQKDKKTQAIVYFGELGGYDEYEIADAIKNGLVNKKVICYIAGVISDMFDKPPQFGHAKAMAGRSGESAIEKKKALKEAGALVADSFAEFVSMVRELPGNEQFEQKYSKIEDMLDTRHKALFSSSISSDRDGKVQLLHEDLLQIVDKNSFAKIVASMFLGRKINSKELESFVDYILKLLVDHGPYVSGAVNTMITARAGRDLVSGLSAGLLTIGPRFGGAINQAALNWLDACENGITPESFVEQFARRKTPIAGIGHKKYRIDLPDPRVLEVVAFSKRVSRKQYTMFAKQVERITTNKKSNLILNVDGAIAAVMLDLLAEKEGYTVEQLHGLVDQEFFNAFFVLGRSVGFISHFLDQKRLDEGLFRLPEDEVADVSMGY